MSGVERSSGPPEGDTISLEGDDSFVPVLDKKRLSFPTSWRQVNAICIQAFEVLDKRPQSIDEEYIALGKLLAKAHGIVYRLTAYPCTDCPALVRGSNYTKVCGDNEESTQVLVVYYLLREMLKRQMQQRKNFDTTAQVVIENYLDEFEKMSAGVNLVKCVFTYIHWVWKKLGLPSEHVVLPTETIAMHLWTDTVVTEVKEKLTTEVARVVKAVRRGEEIDVITIENVKRLSLNLTMLSDGRQAVYTSIVETPYQADMAAFYNKKKQAYKLKGPERYICLCLSALRKEEFLATCFLARLSLDKVRTGMIEILVGSEVEYLQRAARRWLNNEEEARLPVYRASLFGLYEILGGGTKPTWVEDLLTAYVTELAKREILSYKGMPGVETTTHFLRSIKSTYQNLRSMLFDVFGEKPLLLAAMLKGLKEAVRELCEDPQFPTFDGTSVATSLVKIASEEISSGSSQSALPGNWIADIYGLLEKKEVFNHSYEKLLEIRLLKSVCFSLTEENCRANFYREKEMLSALFRQGKNFDFACLCHRMLQDVYVTSIRCRQFIPKSVSMTPLVLSKFMWRTLTLASAEDLSLVPSNVREVVHGFKNAYQLQDIGKGKELTFLPNYSTAVVRMKGVFGNTEIDERLVVSTCQLAILRLFNSKTSWKITSITSELKIAQRHSDESIKPLVDAGLLVWTQQSGELSLNWGYKGTESRRSVLVPEFHFGSVKEAADVDQAHGRGPSSKERQQLCESGIVKILKTEDELSLEQIQVRVCELRSKFNVSRREVKEYLEKLIERQFVSRNSENNAFRYMP